MRIRCASRFWTILVLALTACGGTSGPGGSGPTGDLSNPRGSPWSSPTLVADGVFYPQVTADGEGNILLVWEQGPTDWRNDYYAESVWAKRFVPGSGWGPSEKLWDLGHLGPLNPLNPRVAVLPSGDAIVAWSVRDKTGAVWVDAFDPASGWSPPLRLAETEYRVPGFAIVPKPPMVAAGGDGAFVVFNKDGCTRPTPPTCAVYTYAVHASRWSLKDGFSSPQLVLQAVGERAAADTEGGAFVVGRVPYRGEGLAVARFEAKRGWLPADVLSVTGLAEVWGQAIDSTGSDRIFSSVYEELSVSSSSYSLWDTSFRPGSSWEPPQRIGSSSLRIVGDPTVSWDQNGGAAAVWAQLSPSGIWASRLDSSGPWGEPQALETDASARCPAVASDGSGGFLVAWRQDDTKVSSIWSTGFSQQGWSRPVLVHTVFAAAAWSVGCPMLAATPDGHSLMFWQQTSTAWPPGLRPATGDRAVYMSRFESE